MTFNTFLDRMQKMFNIFCGEGGNIYNSMQVRELFRRVQHPELQYTVKALDVRADLDGIKYSEAANHLTATVSKITEYQFSLKVSFIQSSESKSGSGGPRKCGRNIGSIYNLQGKIHTSYYQNWNGLSEEDSKAVISACKKMVVSITRPLVIKRWQTLSISSHC